jgi:hypothetical protein
MLRQFSIDNIGIQPFFVYLERRKGATPGLKSESVGARVSIHAQRDRHQLAIAEFQSTRPPRS